MSQKAVAFRPEGSESTGTVRRRVRLPVLRAEGGDHPAIYYFLQSVFQGPSRSEFDAWLDDPFYEPRDRLLLRRRRSIVAHIQIAHRTMVFGAAGIPTAHLAWLGVAPEHRRQGLGSHLLRAAESAMIDDGVLVGVLRTSIPEFFGCAGWASCRPAPWRHANNHALLAQLIARNLIPRPRRRLHIRPWRQWEQSALARIYRQNVEESRYLSAMANSHPPRLDPLAYLSRCLPDRLAPPPCCRYGPTERTPAYWHWLLKRHGFDQLLVALEGPEQLELDEKSTHIVGYSVMRGERILELMTEPNHPSAAAELLARCCSDAIELDRHCVLLHGPPTDSLFEIFDSAGGSSPSASECGETWMMRALNPLGLLQRLGGEFNHRANEAGLPRPLELGLLIEGEKYLIELGENSATATSGRLGRSYLRLNQANFTLLALGQLDWDAAVATGLMECSTSLANEAGRALFPKLPFWLSPWDDMPAT